MDDRDVAIDLIETSGELTGALAGAVVTLLNSDPVTGALTGAAIGPLVSKAVKVLGNVYEKVIGRERTRVGAGAAYALDRVRSLQAEGRTLRQDDFFATNVGKRSMAEETLDGVLQKCRDAYEELKLPYIGSIWANLAYSPDIDSSLANMVITMSHGLTWRQFCCVSLFGRATEFADLPDSNYEGRVPLKTAALLSEILQLCQMGLLEDAIDDSDDVYAVLGTGDITPSRLRLSSLGDVVFRLMNLQEVPAPILGRLVDLLNQR